MKKVNEKDKALRLPTYKEVRMNSIVDIFTPDEKVTMKVSEFQSLLRSDALNWADNKCLINGLKAGLPAEHILTMIGENEEVKDESESD